MICRIDRRFSVDQPLYNASILQMATGPRMTRFDGCCLPECLENLIVTYEWTQHVQSEADLDCTYNLCGRPPGCLAQNLQRQIDQRMPVRLAAGASLAVRNGHERDDRRGAASRAFHRVPRCVPVRVAAIVAHLGNQGIQFPDLGGLAAGAGCFHLRLDAPQVSQSLRCANHAGVVQVKAGKVSCSPS